jgi:hypothetical protein
LGTSCEQKISCHLSLFKLTINATQGVLGPPTYNDLSDGAKLLLLQEMTHHMTFKKAVSFLELTDTQIAHFVHLYDREVTRPKTEEAVLESAMERIMRIRMQRDMTDMERQIIWDEEMNAKLPVASCLESISEAEIEDAIAFLKSFRVQEEHGVVEELTPYGLRIVDPGDIPPYLIVAEIVESMQRYTRHGEVFTLDDGQDLGLSNYLIVEMGMFPDADDDDDDVLEVERQVEAKDKDEDETWQPIRRPVGRPRGSKTNKERKPPVNKSRNLNLRISSIKPQDVAGASSPKRPGRPVSRLSSGVL